MRLPVLNVAKCPATFCPLFASQGSPWTGEHDAVCKGDKCGWWHHGRCVATEWAGENLAEAASDPGCRVTPREYDCPYADECQWQQQSSGLCPPRRALRNGISPKVCGY